MADPARAQKLFESAAKVASGAQWDYAIELYIQGLGQDPENIPAHTKLRELSLQRKLKGGKPMGMLQRAKLSKGKAPVENMLYYEKQLAYDPGNADHMKGLLTSAQKGEFDAVAHWIAPVLYKLNIDGKQDLNTFLLLKEAFQKLEEFKLAEDALGYAIQLKPDNQDLSHELKQIATMRAMKEGKYSQGGGFTESLRDKRGQQDLLEKDKGVLDDDGRSAAIAKTKAAHEADPEEAGKIWAYVEALVRTEQRDHEDTAIALLDKTYDRTESFRFKEEANKIRLRQALRMEQSITSMLKQQPDDEDLKKDLADMRQSRYEQELTFAKDAARAYPQDQGRKFFVGKKLFQLGRVDEAIPELQQAQQAAKVRDDAKLLLGRAFLDAQFYEEAAETLGGLLEEYELQDAKQKEMQYWHGRALEETGDTQAASRAYSKVAQTDFNYRDVRSRLAELRKRS